MNSGDGLWNLKKRRIISQKKMYKVPKRADQERPHPNALQRNLKIYPYILGGSTTPKIFTI